MLYHQVSRSLKPGISRRVKFLLIILAFANAVIAVRGEVKFWDGSSSGNWNLGANWTDGIVPAAGDDLIFPAGVTRLLVTNNFNPLRAFRSVTFSGSNYVVYGTNLVVTNGINAQNPTGANTINSDIELRGPQTFDCINGLALLDINSDVALGAHLLTIAGAGDVHIGGVISGTGGVTKNGSGALRYNGDVSNTYSGLTRVNTGTLELGKLFGLTSIPRDLIIGDNVGGLNADVVRLLNDHQISNFSDITINQSGLLALNNQDETLGPLTLFEGAITTGIGTLTLNGDITATGLAGGAVNGATISGRLNLGTGTRTIETLSGGNAAALYIDATVSGTNGFTKTGTASMRLASSNSYTGVTIISDGTLGIEDSFALGSTASDDETIVESGAALLLSGQNMVVRDRLELHGPGASAGLGALWTANGTTNAYDGIVTLADATSIGVVGANGRLSMGNRITGSGGFTKLNTGTLVLDGGTDNLYAGATIVNEGTLELAKTGSLIEAISGSALIIGDGVGGSQSDVVLYTGSSTSQILSSVPITVNSSGLLDLNDHSDDLGALTLNAGKVHTGTGTLALGGNVTATSDATTIAFISGRVSMSSTRTFNVNQGVLAPDLRISADIVGAGGLTKTGDGWLALSGSNSYAGTTTVIMGTLAVEDSFALGSTNAPTIVQSAAGLVLEGSGIHVGLEQLTISTATNRFGISSYTGSNSWAGNIILSSDILVRVVGDLTLSGAISGAGGITKLGTGSLYYRGNAANSYTGDTRVHEGTLVLAKSLVDGSIIRALYIGDGIGGALSDVVRIVGFSQISTLNSDVTIASSGLFDLNDIGEGVRSLSGSGRVDLGTGLLGINGPLSTTYSGLILGTGGLSKAGLGTLTLTANNTYSGQTLVSSGALIVNGSQPQSAMVVNNTATLGGDGIVGNLSATGTVAPGSSPAILTCSNVALNATANFVVELNGPAPGTGYDQLNVRGTNQLGGAALNVSVGYPPSEGQEFVIINNDGSEAIVGTFAGLPNGATFFANGLQFRIRYSDVFNNDVVLTVTNTALRVTNVVVSTGNGNGAVDPNECNELSVPLRNPFAGLASNVSAILSSDTPGVIVTQPYSTYPNIPASSTRTNITPFQFYTTPAFVCGTNISFTLTVATATNGAFQVHFNLPSGSPGTAQSFTSSTAQAIPDLGTLNSVIGVAGIPSAIKQVTVAVHITHTSVNDLDISLIAPDGTTVELSSDNGATASDYGTDCSNGRTVFSDLAVSSITAASAPFVGTFRPEQPLSAFNDMSGSDAAGLWTLRIVDDTGGAVGTLRCWTLSIRPTVCSPSDGPCEPCGAPIIGAIMAGDPLQTGRLNRDATASSCAPAKECPTLTDTQPRAYDAYTFTNIGPAACAVVHFRSFCGTAAFSAAYAGAFVPSDLCLNYLGDAGRSSSAVTPYSFFVPSNGVFVVVVHEVNPGTGCTNYTLEISGIQCPPRLNIEPVAGNRVALRWSSAAVGYNLLAAPDLQSPPPNFVPLPGAAPFIVDGKYSVTNPASLPKRFFELRKP
jgi:autotransporter-associated beta strand protein